MKKLLVLSLGLCGLGLVAQPPPPGGRMRGGFGPGFGPEGDLMHAGPASRTPVTGAPYSGVQSMQFVQALPGGNQIARQEQVKVFRDSQGRVRTERTFTPPNSTARTMISISDPVAGNSYVLDSSRSMAVKMPMPPGQFGQGPHGRGPGGAGSRAARNPEQTENLGTQSVNGVTATGTRITETIAAGEIGNAQPIQIVREVWVSNDLKVPVMIKTSDPRFGSTVMQLTNIVQSEPEAALFQVPSTYTVTTRENRAFGAGRHQQ